MAVTIAPTARTVVAMAVIWVARRSDMGEGYCRAMADTRKPGQRVTRLLLPGSVG